MVALANRGQVITSDTTTMTLSPWLRSRVRELDSLTVKGKGSDIGIYELICDAEDEVTTLSTRLAVPPARIRLKHDARTLELGPEAEVVTLGRDPGSDVVIADRLASRAHARIERRRDKFVLIDQSTNGSYVTFEGEAEILVRREMLTLRGSGRISFGHAYSVDPTEVVSFVCGAWAGLTQS
jgi:adenylate cyclase